MPRAVGVKQIAKNKKAYHDYFVLETLEAGIELSGTEVKSIRAGNINLKDSYCAVQNGEMLMHNVHISPYEQGNIFNKDPKRDRRLLLHRREILRLYGKVKQDGLTIVPLTVYLKNALVKVEIGLVKGKKLYDKREAAAQKAAGREMERTLKERNA